LDIPELGGKQIELLKNVVPTLTRLAALWDATIDTLQFHAIETAARGAKANAAMAARAAESMIFLRIVTFPYC
jgi:hypothetical protein